MSDQNPEIEPLTDESLEDVAGGSSSESCCSCADCSNGGGTSPKLPEPIWV